MIGTTGMWKDGSASGVRFVLDTRSCFWMFIDQTNKRKHIDVITTKIHWPLYDQADFVLTFSRYFDAFICCSVKVCQLYIIMYAMTA